MHFCLFFMSICSIVIGDDIKNAFIRNEIVPDVIPDAPTQLVTMNYPSGVSVELGNVLTPTLVKDKPTLKWTSKANTLYTLMMVDPDAPSRQNKSVGEVRHWLVVNISGDAVSNGLTIADFVGAGPREHTGLHRYVVLVFEQKHFIEYHGSFISNRTDNGRLRTKAREFIEEHELGNAVAGNFFLAEYDDYVPYLYAHLIDE